MRLTINFYGGNALLGFHILILDPVTGKSGGNKNNTVVTST
jgi:hypothetical protein